MAERAPPQPNLPLRKNSGAGILPSRWTWVTGGITSFEGACCQGHYPTHPYSKSPSQPVTEASENPKVTATRKTARPQKSELITTAAPKLAVGKSKKKTVASVKIAATEPTTPTWWSQNDVPPPHSRKCLISSITVPYMHVWR